MLRLNRRRSMSMANWNGNMAIVLCGGIMSCIFVDCDGINRCILAFWIEARVTSAEGCLVQKWWRVGREGIAGWYYWQWMHFIQILSLLSGSWSECWVRDWWFLWVLDEVCISDVAEHLIVPSWLSSSLHVLAIKGSAFQMNLRSVIFPVMINDPPRLQSWNRNTSRIRRSTSLTRFRHGSSRPIRPSRNPRHHNRRLRRNRSRNSKPLPQTRSQNHCTYQHQSVHLNGPQNQ